MLIGACVALLLVPAAGFAQGIGIGPRLTFIRGSADSPDGTQRLLGGVLRLGGGHAAVEVAMDFKSDVSGDLTEQIKSYPIQGSFLLYPVRARLAPYLLAGLGWYTQHVTYFSAPTGTVVLDETTRKMGYHAGFGAEVRAHRHFGFYGDYRYTMINVGDDDEGGASILPGWMPGAQRLAVSHEGSMFTWGAVFYF
jgi:hypothetical protein